MARTTTTTTNTTSATTAAAAVRRRPPSVPWLQERVRHFPGDALGRVSDKLHALPPSQVDEVAAHHAVLLEGG
jgi:hypothetical protein